MKPIVAWTLVALQFVLITLLLAIPQGTLWPTGLIAGVLAGAMLLGGIVIGTISVLKLGKALTPNPIPRLDGHLETRGLYALVRHPIYSAVLLAMLGVVVWGAGVWHLVFLDCCSHSWESRPERKSDSFWNAIPSTQTTAPELAGLCQGLESFVDSASYFLTGAFRELFC